MEDEYKITCEYCGCNFFELYFAGIHIKAVCSNCQKTVQNNYSGSTYNTHFIKQLEYDNTQQVIEEATSEQIRGIRYRVYHEYESLSKVDAGDIIGIFERSKRRK